MKYVLPVPIPTEAEIEAAEKELDFTFPPSYKEFLRAGGLSDLRLSSAVLSPDEILASWRALSFGNYVPFAENGCGDSYCWPRHSSLEPGVVFHDHESRQASEKAAGFTEWLELQRF